MKIVFSEKAEKQFLKLDHPIQKQIQKFVKRLEQTKNPRETGKMLVGHLLGFWRYRVGNYRLICRIQDKELVIIVVEVGHRRKVYASRRL